MEDRLPLDVLEAHVLEADRTREAGERLRERWIPEGWFSVATFQEPGWRIEGKKTLGLELAEPAAPDLATLLASDARPEADRARDAGRKPAEVLAALWDDSGRRARLGLAARETVVRHFTIDAFADRLLAVCMRAKAHP